MAPAIWACEAAQWVKATVKIRRQRYIVGRPLRPPLPMPLKESVYWCKHCSKFQDYTFYDHVIYLHYSCSTGRTGKHTKNNWVRHRTSFEEVHGWTSRLLESSIFWIPYPNLLVLSVRKRNQIFLICKSSPCVFVWQPCLCVFVYIVAVQSKMWAMWKVRST